MLSGQCPDLSITLLPLPPTGIEAITQFLLQSPALDTIHLLWPRVLALSWELIRDGNLTALLLLELLELLLLLLLNGCANEISEVGHLLKDHSAHLRHLIDNLEAEVEFGGAIGLISSIVPDGQIGMLQCFFDSDAGCRIERQKLVEQIESIWIGAREQGMEVDPRHKGEVSHILLCAWRPYTTQRGFAWSA